MYKKSKIPHVSLFFAFFLLIACEKKAPVVSLSQNPTINLFSIPDAIERQSEENTYLMVNVADPQGLDNINEVHVEIYQDDIRKDVALMWDNGEEGDIIANNGTFTYSFVPRNLQFANGQVLLIFQATDRDNHLSSQLIDTLVVIEFFDNEPPQLSDLSMADEINRDVSFTFSVQVFDPNGRDDVLRVFFKLYRPDGSLSTPGGNNDFFLMADNGNTDVYGDAIANDGIYSFKNSFSQTSQTGSWRFEIQAQDKSGAKSNLLVHTITVL